MSLQGVDYEARCTRLEIENERLRALEDEVRRVVNCPRGDCDCPCRSWTTWVLKQLKEALP